MGYSALEGHGANAAAHEGTELNTSGDPTPGFCAYSGCHTSANLKAVHGATCALEGCHKTGTAPTIKSCGGSDPATACHNGFSASQHFVDHSANLSGTVNGITYGAGENEGCLGCHPGDLHATRTPRPRAARSRAAAPRAAACATTTPPMRATATTLRLPTSRPPSPTATTAAPPATRAARQRPAPPRRHRRTSAPPRRRDCRLATCGATRSSSGRPRSTLRWAADTTSAGTR